MDLRAKLARLKPSAAAPARATSPEPAPPGEGAKLEELRARLGALVARSREKEARKREERRAEIEARLRAAPLPFDEHETPLGPLHVRVVHTPPSHRVGRIPVQTGHGADPSALALLALDPALRDVDPRRALYLDTEATGLAGGTGTIPFLVGLAWFEDEAGVEGGLRVEQLLLRSLGDEAPILARLAERIAAASMLVSFNGKAFDLPLLRTRFVMNRLSPPREPPHLDLVHVARRVHRSVRGRGEGDPRTGPAIERVDEHDEARRATSCKLVALERQILGFARVDDVPSSEVPARYGHFLRTGDADAIRAVCDHNLWDVVSMAALVGVYAESVRALDEPEREGGVAARDETVASLDGRDFVGLARTLRRAGDLARARKAADVAIEAADESRVDRADPELATAARRTRGGIAKGARDTQTALLDFGVLAEEHDDPAARLELAKLYEHRVRDPARALDAVRAGTTEQGDAAARRLARLERKASRTRASLPFEVASSRSKPEPT